MVCSSGDGLPIEFRVVLTLCMLLVIFSFLLDCFSKSDEYERYKYKKKVKREKKLEDKIRKDRILLMEEYSKMSSVEPWKIKYSGKG
jgi:hypothetical protein